MHIETNFLFVNFFHRPKLIPPEKERPTVLKFPSHSDLSGVALQLDEVEFFYNKDRTIFKNVNLSASYECRICIVSYLLADED